MSLRLRLLRWQLIIVYTFGAASKVNPTFLSGSVIALNLRPAFGELASGRTLPSLALAAIVAEGLVAWSLLRPRWRVAGAIIGIGLHLGFIVMIKQTLAMIVFAVICLSIYPLFWLDDRRT